MHLLTIQHPWFKSCKTYAQNFKRRKGCALVRSHLQKGVSVCMHGLMMEINIVFFWFLGFAVFNCVRLIGYWALFPNRFNLGTKSKKDIIRARTLIFFVTAVIIGSRVGICFFHS